MTEYPYPSGNETVLGPRIFANTPAPTKDTVINWVGVNFTPQAAHDEVKHDAVLLIQDVMEAREQRDAAQDEASRLMTARDDQGAITRKLQDDLERTATERDANAELGIKFQHQLAEATTAIRLLEVANDKQYRVIAALNEENAAQAGDLALARRELAEARTEMDRIRKTYRAHFNAFCEAVREQADDLSPRNVVAARLRRLIYRFTQRSGSVTSASSEQQLRAAIQSTIDAMERERTVASAREATDEPPPTHREHVNTLAHYIRLLTADLAADED